MWSNQQWALNPNAYQNVSHEDVDWAALAQQWIIMREGTTTSGKGAQEPNESKPERVKVEKVEKDQGEAPMDVVDQAHESTSNVDSNSNQEYGNSESTWNNWQQWGWNWNNSENQQASSSNREQYGYTTTSAASTSDEFPQGNPSATQPTFWTGQATGMAEPTSFFKDDNNFHSNRNRFIWRREEKDKEREGDRGKLERENSSGITDDAVETLDAAKRKQLPAWIREGLEKMEREKQRKIDKEKSDREREEYLRKKRLEEEEALSKIDSAEAKAKFLSRSKFDSDSEHEEEKYSSQVEVKQGKAEMSSSNNTDTKDAHHLHMKHRKSRFHDTSINSFSNIGSPHSSTHPTKGPPDEGKTVVKIEHEQIPSKSRQESIDDVMLNVRKTLTEILLDVTTAEMRMIAEKVHRSVGVKAPAKRLPKSQAFASIATKSGLGLGIYGSDNDDDDDSDSDDDKYDNAGGSGTAFHLDSDEELEATIQRKKSEFEKTARQIEDLLQAELEKELEEESQLQDSSTEENVEDDKSDGESSHQKSKEEKNINTEPDRLSPIQGREEKSEDSKRSSTSSQSRVTKRESVGKQQDRSKQRISTPSPNRKLSHSRKEKSKRKRSKDRYSRHSRHSSRDSSTSKSSTSLKKHRSRRERNTSDTSDSDLSYNSFKSKDRKESSKGEKYDERKTYKSSDRRGDSKEMSRRKGKEVYSREKSNRNKRRSGYSSSSSSRSRSSSVTASRQYYYRDRRRRSRSKRRSRSRSSSVSNHRRRRRESSSSSSRSACRSSKRR